MTPIEDWNKDHDKAMEIPEVPNYDNKKYYIDEWSDKLTTSLNLLIKAHNNK